MTDKPIKHTPWRPNLVFYNTETESLFKSTLEFEELTSRKGHKGTQYSTPLCDIEPGLKMQRVTTLQIKALMKDSLPNQIKGLPNG